MRAAGAARENQQPSEEKRAHATGGQHAPCESTVPVNRYNSLTMDTSGTDTTNMGSSDTKDSVATTNTKMAATGTKNAMAATGGPG